MSLKNSYMVYNIFFEQDNYPLYFQHILMGVISVGIVTDMVDNQVSTLVAVIQV